MERIGKLSRWMAELWTWRKANPAMVDSVQLPLVRARAMLVAAMSHPPPSRWSGSSISLRPCECRPGPRKLSSRSAQAFKKDGRRRAFEAAAATITKSPKRCLFKRILISETQPILSCFIFQGPVSHCDSFSIFLFSYFMFVKNSRFFFCEMVIINVVLILYIFCGEYRILITFSFYTITATFMNSTAFICIHFFKQN